MAPRNNDPSTSFKKKNYSTDPDCEMDVDAIVPCLLHKKHKVVKLVKSQLEKMRENEAFQNLKLRNEMRGSKGNFSQTSQRNQSRTSSRNESRIPQSNELRTPQNNESRTSQNQITPQKDRDFDFETSKDKEAEKDEKDDKDTEKETERDEALNTEVIDRTFAHSHHTHHRRNGVRTASRVNRNNNNNKLSFFWSFIFFLLAFLALTILAAWLTAGPLSLTAARTPVPGGSLITTDKFQNLEKKNQLRWSKPEYSE